MKMVNLTPHDLSLCDAEGEVIVRIEKSGQVARVNSLATEIGEVEVNGQTVPIVSTKFGEIENLPKPQLDTVYVVSIVVLSALNGQRDDVMAPDTGPQSVVRNEDGTIKAVRRFTR